VLAFEITLIPHHLCGSAIPGEGESAAPQPAIRYLNGMGPFSGVSPARGCGSPVGLLNTQRLQAFAYDDLGPGELAPGFPALIMALLYCWPFGP